MLCWNVGGLNATRKWDSIKNKIKNANCDIVWFQETKKDAFDQAFLRQILPPAFDEHLFVPSVGASGGLLVAWKSTIFAGSPRLSCGYALALDFTSKYNDNSWTLINVYGPCSPEGKREFTNRLQNLDIPSMKTGSSLETLIFTNTQRTEIDQGLSSMICSFSTTL